MMTDNLNFLFSALKGSSLPVAGSAPEMVDGEWASAWEAVLTRFQDLGANGEGAAFADFNDGAVLQGSVAGTEPEGAPIMAELLAQLLSLAEALEAVAPGLDEAAIDERVPGSTQSALAQLVAALGLLAAEGAENDATQDPSETAQAGSQAPALAAELLRLIQGQLEAGVLPVEGGPRSGLPERGPEGATVSALALAASGMRFQGLDSGQSRAPGATETPARAPESVAREQILGRVAELLAGAREWTPPENRNLPEMMRSVLAAATGGAVSSTPGPVFEPTQGGARSDVLLSSLAPLQSGREPLPSPFFAQGQPGSSAAELRAAAEQAMERVVWMAARKQGSSQARLQLHPAHLGKLDIRLDVQGREASLHLGVHSAPVREALEAMLPRLREQLEQQGLQLGDASVSDSGPEEAPDRETAERADPGGEFEEDSPSASIAETDTPRRGLGLLDEFA